MVVGAVVGRVGFSFGLVFVTGARAGSGVAFRAAAFDGLAFFRGAAFCVSVFSAGGAFAARSAPLGIRVGGVGTGALAPAFATAFVASCPALRGARVGRGGSAGARVAACRSFAAVFLPATGPVLRYASNPPNVPTRKLPEDRPDVNVQSAPRRVRRGYVKYCGDTTCATLAGAAGQPPLGRPPGL
jgi:hypothetical protein